MPSTYTPFNRIEEQATGENVNTYGVKLDFSLARVDDAISRVATIALTGDYTLTTSNDNSTTDDARAMGLKFSGVGATVKLPSLNHRYDVWNTTSGVVTLTTGSGLTVAVQSGEVVPVICDGTNVVRSQGTYFASQQISGVADPTSPQQVATMAYVTAQIMGAMSGTFPGQAGANGWALFSNGVTPFWKQIASTDLSDTAARDAAALGRAVAMAVAL